MTIYDDLQAVAKDVLGEFDQGGLSRIEITTVPGGNEWDLPTENTTTVATDAVVSGVSSKYVDGERILMTDLMATVAGDIDITTSDAVTVDGNAVQIVQVEPVPASGTAAIKKIILRR